MKADNREHLAVQDSQDVAGAGRRPLTAHPPGASQQA